MSLHLSSYVLCSCDVPLGVNGDHAIRCRSSAGCSTIRHNQVRGAFANAAQRFKLEVHRDTSGAHSTFEFAFGLDERGNPTSLRSDLHLTDPDTRKQYVVDITISEALLDVNINDTSSRGSFVSLEKAYKAHVATYGDICEARDITFVPIAMDSLGRMHKESAAALKTLFKTGRAAPTPPLVACCRPSRAFGGPSATRFTLQLRSVSSALADSPSTSS